jgi:hypothetical protein
MNLLKRPVVVAYTSLPPTPPWGIGAFFWMLADKTGMPQFGFGILMGLWVMLWLYFLIRWMSCLMLNPPGFGPPNGAG